MAITYDKDGAYIEVTDSVTGAVYRRAIRWEDCLVSVPEVGTEKIDMVYVNSSDQLVLVLEDESEITIADLTGAEIVALLEALGSGSRLSHTKLDDVGASDHHTKYTDAAAKAAAVLAGAITNGETKAPTHDAVFDVKATADAAQPAATDDADAVAAVEAAGLTLAAAKAIEYTTPTANHTASGIIVTKTAGAALVFGNACYTGTDGKMEKALADDAAITIPATHLCIATIAEDATGLFLEQGEADDDSWTFDVGKSVYLSKDTAGLITKTMPTKVTGNQVQVLGMCVEDATKIFWNPSPIVVEYA